MNLNKSVAPPINYSQADQADEDGLKIAWRYNALPKIDAEQKISNQGHCFDLTKLITPESLNELQITIFDSSLDTSVCSPIFTNKHFGQLLNSIKSAIASQEQKNLLRISINSMGSPLWYDSNFSKDICLFLTILKAIVRNSLAVCFVTIPAHLLKHYVRDKLLFFMKHF